MRRSLWRVVLPGAGGDRHQFLVSGGTLHDDGFLATLDPDIILLLDDDALFAALNPDVVLPLHDDAFLIVGDRRRTWRVEGNACSTVGCVQHGFGGSGELREEGEEYEEGAIQVARSIMLRDLVIIFGFLRCV